MPTVVSGSPVYGADFPPSQYDQDWTSQLNITSTTHVVGTPEVGVNYTAPTSGKAFVMIGAGIRNNAATNERAIVTYRIFRDSSKGAVVQAANSDVGIKSCGIAASQEYTYRGNFSLVTDLTPGVNYYFQVVHLSVNGAGTVDIASRDIAVIPVP